MKRNKKALIVEGGGQEESFPLVLLIHLLIKISIHSMSILVSLMVSLSYAGTLLEKQIIT